MAAQTSGALELAPPVRSAGYKFAPVPPVKANPVVSISVPSSKPVVPHAVSIITASLEAAVPTSLTAATEPLAGLFQTAWVPRFSAEHAAGRKSARRVGSARRSAHRRKSSDRRAAIAQRASRRQMGAKLQQAPGQTSVPASYDASRLRSPIQVGLRTPFRRSSKRSRESRTRSAVKSSTSSSRVYILRNFLDVTVDTSSTNTGNHAKAA